MCKYRDRNGRRIAIPIGVRTWKFRKLGLWCQMQKAMADTAYTNSPFLSHAQRASAGDALATPAATSPQHLCCISLPTLTVVITALFQQCKKQKTTSYVRNFSARNSGAGKAAPILWVPGIFWFFLLETPRAHNIPRFRGGGGSWVFWKGWKCQFYLHGRGDFSDKKKNLVWPKIGTEKP